MRNSSRNFRMCCERHQKRITRFLPSAPFCENSVAEGGFKDSGGMTIANAEDDLNSNVNKCSSSAQIRPMILSITQFVIAADFAPEGASVP